MHFTMLRTWADDPSRPDDYVFRVDGKNVGRCYRMIAADTRLVWHWTLYGKSISGMEETLADAQFQFKRAFEALYPQ